MSILDNVKAVAEILQKADNIELYKDILNIQAEAMDLMDQIRVLKNENYELKEKFRIKEELRFVNDLYWVINCNEEKDGPFCSRCFDEKDRLIRMHSKKSSHRFVCPVCDIKVSKSGIDEDFDFVLTNG